MIIVKNRELLIPRNEQYIGTPNDNNADNRVFRISRLSQTGEDLSGLTYRLDLLYPDMRNVYTVSAVTSRSGRSVVVLTTLFARQYPAAGTYTFSFDGTNWKHNNQNVTLSEVGIIIAYNPVSGDTVTVTSTIQQVITDTVLLSKEITDEYINLTWTVTAAQLAIPGTVYVTLRGANDDAEVRWASFQGAFYVEQNNYTPAMFTGPMSELEYFEQVLSSNLVKLEYLPTKYEDLENAVEDAEAWAKGTRSGSEVQEEDDTYHNNSKYYSELANASKNAAAASQSAAAASQSAAAASASQAAQIVPDLINGINTETNRAKAAENALQQSISTEVSTRSAAVSSLQSQINQYVTPSTQQPDEVVNARVGADGTTYSTLGDAVRGQVTDLKSTLLRKIVSGVTGVNIYDKTGTHSDITLDYYRPYYTGDMVALTGYEVFTLPVSGNVDYVVNKNNIHVCFFSNERATTYISGFLANASNGYTFRTPSNAVTMTLSFEQSFADTFQLEYGTVSSSYEPFVFGIDMDDVLNLDETLDGLRNDFDTALIKKLDGIPGKNLFDKTGVHSDILSGYYRNYSNGALNPLASYELVTVDVISGTNYAVNTNNTHVCFFSDDDLSHFISGFLVNASNGYTFTVPNNAIKMTLSFAISNADTFQLEYGTEKSGYAPFRFGIDASNVFNGGVIAVGPRREYTTVQSAVDAATNGDTILIDPGVYNEAVDMVGKHLHLVGSGRDSTIITYSGDDYYYPPLEVSEGLIENLSFITTATEKAEGAIDTSYCVHIDYDAEIGKSLQFVNCYFESPIRPTVGIGLRENFTLNFTNCKFKSGTYPVYFHEQQASNKTGQKIELVDCSIQSTGRTAAIHMQESAAYSGNVVTVLMQRCIAKANGVSGNSIITAGVYPGNVPPSGSHYRNTNSFYLDSMSALNNEQILNA